MKEFLHLLNHPEEMSDIPAMIILVASTITLTFMWIWAI